MSWPVAPLRLQMSGAMLCTVALPCLRMVIAQIWRVLPSSSGSPLQPLPLLCLNLIWLILGGGLLAGRAWAWGLGRQAPLLCLVALAAMVVWGPKAVLEVEQRSLLVLIFSPAVLALHLQVAIDVRHCPPGATHTAGLRWSWVWLHWPLALGSLPATFIYILACS